MHDSTSRFVRFAGWFCLIGAMLGAVGGLATAFFPPAVAADRFSYPFTPAGYIAVELAFAANHLMLLVGIMGVAGSAAAGHRRTGRIGLWVAMIGLGLLTLCELRAITLANSTYPNPDTDLLDMAYGAATILIGLGLTAAGIAIVRVRRWHGWARHIVLACGAAVFVIVIPGVFSTFLLGRLVLIAWMLMFAALGGALIRASR